MDKKEKKMNPPKDVPNKKNIVMSKVKKHLMMKIGIPVFVIIIFLSLFIIRSPYTAKEKYTELQPYTEEVTKVVENRDNPIQVRVCQEEEIPVKVTMESVYGKAVGLTGYKCYGEFKIMNLGDNDGIWSYRYLFNISEKLVQTDPFEQKIPKFTSWKFVFETEDCIEADKKEGHYIMVSAPTKETCKYEIQYNRTMTVNETKQREMQRERIITKYETLWEKLTGYNRFEKI